MDLRKLKDKAAEAFKKGKFQKAAELYEELCTADAKDTQARLRLGDAWAKVGNKAKAIDAYRASAEGFAREGHLHKAIAASKLILELDPTHQGVQQMLADLYAQKTGPATSPASKPPMAKAEPPFAPKPPLAAPKAKPAPAPSKRHEAIELPDYEAPTEATGDSNAWMKAQAGPSWETRKDAIDIGDESVKADGPAPLTEKAIEIEVTPAPAQVPIEGEASSAWAGVEIEVEPPARPAAMPAAVSSPGHEPPLIEAEPEVVAELEVISSPVEITVDASAAPAAVAPQRGAPTPPPEAELEEIVPDEELPPEPPAPPPASAEAPVMPPPQPPGLRPRPEATPAASRIWIPPVAPPQSLPVDAKARPTAQHEPTRSHRRDVQASLAALSKFDEFERELDELSALAPLSTSAPPPQPAKGRPHGVPSFTELALEGDSLLHAVETAAAAGVALRRSKGGAETLEEDERIETPAELAAEKGEPGALPKIPLFSDLPPEAFIALFERCPLRRFAQGERIIAQGALGDAFYVICEGSAQVWHQDPAGGRRDIARLGDGAFFGEMALLSGAPRSANVDAGEDETQVLEISAPILTELSHRHPPVAAALKKFCRQRMLSNVMATSALFRPFTKGDRRELVQRFRAREVGKGELIVREGERSDGLYVLLSGEVEVHRGAARLAVLREGDLFGEISLLTKQPATASVLASKRTSLLRLPRTDFEQLIMSHPQILMLVSELSEQRRQSGTGIV